jgi:hypothetical protein
MPVSGQPELADQGAQFFERQLMRSAVTISLVREASGGPFVFWHDLASGCAQAAELGFDGVEVFPRAADELDIGLLRNIPRDRYLLGTKLGRYDLTL